MAVGWGGLMAAIGVLVGAERGSTMRIVALVVSFLLGGFLAGVRAHERRPLHAAVAAVAAYAFYGLFVVIGHIVDILGGPEPPSFMPGDNVDWGVAAAVALIAAIAGGLVASVRLRPGRRNHHRRHHA
jgi:peptidoglycan/LPS O-acetylase OafA/YrhL